jgi:2-iminobutanoate/2-iminopropanoate deaminase
MMTATKQELRVEGIAAPLSHYTDTVVHGDLVFVSGALALDVDGHLIGEGDIVAQARAVHENLARCLAAAGSDFTRVLKVNIYLTDINDRAAINPVRQEFFGQAMPASTLVQVSALAVPGAALEIELIAARDH